MAGKFGNLENCGHRTTTERSFKSGAQLRIGFLKSIFRLGDATQNLADRVREIDPAPNSIHQMRKISSRMTFWYRCLFPIFWFGFLALWTLLATLSSGRDRPPLFALFFPAFMAL